jgi:CheY-like chemotaxis protein
VLAPDSIYVEYCQTPAGSGGGRRIHIGPSKCRRMTVLVVDDEPAIRRIVCRALADPGHVVLQADSGEAALALIQDEHRPLDLVITDLVMPGIGGLALAAVLSVFRPELPVLAMTGHSSLVEPDRRLPILTKPFTIPELRAAVAGTRVRVRRVVGQGREQRTVSRRLLAAAEATPSRGNALRSNSVDLLAMARLLQVPDRN